MYIRIDYLHSHILIFCYFFSYLLLLLDALFPPPLQAVLNLYPYHIDSLLQLSEVCRMTEDYQMGADLIGLCIYSRIQVPRPYIHTYIQNICTYVRTYSTYICGFTHCTYVCTYVYTYVGIGLNTATKLLV